MDTNSSTTDVAGRSPKIWRNEVRKPAMSNGKFYSEVAAGRIKIVKCGRSTIVVTSPSDYLAALATEAV